MKSVRAFAILFVSFITLFATNCVTAQTTTSIDSAKAVPQSLVGIWKGTWLMRASSIHSRSGNLTIFSNGEAVYSWGDAPPSWTDPKRGQRVGMIEMKGEKEFSFSNNLKFTLKDEDMLFGESGNLYIEMKRVNPETSSSNFLGKWSGEWRNPDRVEPCTIATTLTVFEEGLLTYTWGACPALKTPTSGAYEKVPYFIEGKALCFYTPQKTGKKWSYVLGDDNRLHATMSTNNYIATMTHD